MMTELGGAVAVPSAVRSSDSTTTIRVNDVIMIRIDGATDSTVNSAISWIARSVTPPLPWPPPRLMLMSCAHAGAASSPAVTIVAKNKTTLRGGPAALTKDSSGGRAARPFRLRDCRSRSSGQAPRAPAATRCGEELRGQPAVPAQPGAQRRRLRGVEVLPRAAGPSRQDSDPPKILQVPMLASEVALAGAPRDALREPAAWAPLQPAARDAASWARFGACAGRAVVRCALRSGRPSARARNRRAGLWAPRGAGPRALRHERPAARGAAAAQAFAAQRDRTVRRGRLPHRPSRSDREAAQSGAAHPRLRLRRRWAPPAAAAIDPGRAWRARYWAGRRWRADRRSSGDVRRCRAERAQAAVVRRPRPHR